MSEDFNPTEWITTQEAAQVVGCTSRNILKAIAKGRLKGVKRGGAYFLTRKEVVAYAEEMRRLGPQKHDPWRTGARRKDDGAD